MEKTIYIGREKELNELIDHLGETSMGSEARSGFLYCLSGPEKIGKKALLEQLFNALSRSPKKRLCLELNEPALSETICEQFQNNLHSNDPELSSRITKFKRSLAKSGHKTPKPSDGSSNSQEARFAQLCHEFFAEFFSAARDSEVQFTIALTDYDKWSLDAKSLVNNYLNGGILGVGRTIDVRFFITSIQSIADNFDLNTYWESFLKTWKEISLQPLQLESTEEWLRAKELPISYAPKLYELTRGIPGKFDEALEGIIELFREAEWLKMADALFKNRSVAQCDSIRKSAFLEECSEESLRVFFSEAECADIYRYLKRQTDLPRREVGTVFFLDTDLRKAIRKWVERKEPDNFKKYSLKVESYNEICKTLPSTSGRRVLSDLNYFSCFNTEVVHQVFPDRAALIMEFCQQNLNLFERSGINWRLIPSIQKSIQKYDEIMGIAHNPVIVKKIAECWTNKREQILQQVKQTEKKLQQQTTSINGIQQNIKAVSKEIFSEQEILNKLNQKRNEPPPPLREPKRPVVTSVVMQIFGTGILYVSILFSNRVSLVYAMVGIGLIIAGLFLQTKKMPVTQPQSSMPTIADTSRYEKNIHFLNLKRNQIQNKLGTINADIGRMHNMLKDFEQQLREPYN
jgi:hypothetical protein